VRTVIDHGGHSYNVLGRSSLIKCVNCRSSNSLEIEGLEFSLSGQAFSGVPLIIPLK